jgi:hypothetical protein
MQDRATELLRENTQDPHRQLTPDTWAAIQAIWEAITQTRTGNEAWQGKIDPIITQSDPPTYGGWTCLVWTPRTEKHFLLYGANPAQDYSRIIEQISWAIPQRHIIKLGPLGTTLSHHFGYTVAEAGHPIFGEPDGT